MSYEIIGVAFHKGSDTIASYQKRFIVHVRNLSEALQELKKIEKREGIVMRDVQIVAIL